MTMTPAEAFKLSRDFVTKRMAAGARADIAGDLESKGWRHFLTTLFPFWFGEEFSEDHCKFWEHYWNVLQKIKNKQPVSHEDLCMIVIWGRGSGKSSVVECARIMRGAILNGGYSLMFSETDDQSIEHLGNARILIEHPESRLVEFYPGMAIAENADSLKGMRTADRAEMFVCRNGYICRAKGLASKMRGLRVGVLRPDDLCGDDIDDVGDSLVVSLNKLRLITASILPVQARQNVTITLAQNLISEHSVVNQIYTGKSDALAARTVFGVSNTFSTLDIESAVDETGKLRHTILPTSIPTWSGLDVSRAQKFLSDSGLATFKAEYQNEFSQFLDGKVIKEYSEPRQLITWSMFEKVYGTRQIPADWKCQAALDVGYTEGASPHYSAWSFVATSAMNTALPKKVFVYRSKTFKGVSIDDQAVAIKKCLYRKDGGGMDVITEKPIRWQISHEKTGEMLTLNQKYGMEFQKIKHFQANDGIAQWRHLSRPQKTVPNPFKPDELQEDGTYAIGDCDLFYIVDDDQLQIPEDDAGLALLREQVSGWEYVPVKVTETGQTVQKPSKVNDDVPDSLKAIFTTFSPTATLLTKPERMQKQMNTLYPKGTIESVEDESLRAHLYSARSMKAAEVREQIEKTAGAPTPSWNDMG